jgi:hypothetical protein
VNFNKTKPFGPRNPNGVHVDGENVLKPEDGVDPHTTDEDVLR